MIYLIPSFVASKQRQHKIDGNFLCLSQVSSWILFPSYCIILNKMKLTRWSMLIWRVSCAFIWDNSGVEETKLVDYPIRALFGGCGGGRFVSRLTRTCQTEKKNPCQSEGKKNDFNAKWDNSVEKSVGDKLKKYMYNILLL